MKVPHEFGAQLANAIYSALDWIKTRQATFENSKNKRL